MFHMVRRARARNATGCYHRRYRTRKGGRGAIPPADSKGDRMRRFCMLAVGIAAIAITACSRGPEHIQAGEWEMRMKLTDFDAPGAPAEMVASSRAQLNQERTTRSCITPEQATNPLRDVRAAMTQVPAGASCNTEEDRFAGGVIRLRVTCRATNGQQGQATIAMDGSFSETTLQATMTMTAQGTEPGGAQRTLRVNSEVRGIRVGDCPGSQARPGNTL
jgi:hypothetical protein